MKSIPVRSSEPRGWAGALPILLCIVVPTLGGCATVAPYERGRLARQDMEFERNGELVKGRQHATAYREGSAGAEGASGGGCGCN